MDFHRKLAALRRAGQMTQERAAEALGVSPKTLSKWENGRSCPDIFLLPAIAALYGVTTDELLSDSPLSASAPGTLRIRFAGKHNGDRGEIVLSPDRIGEFMRGRKGEEDNLFTGDSPSALKSLRYSDVRAMFAAGVKGKILSFEDEEDRFEIFLE